MKFATINNVSDQNMTLSRTILQEDICRYDKHYLAPDNSYDLVLFPIVLSPLQSTARRKQFFANLFRSSSAVLYITTVMLERLYVGRYLCMLGYNRNCNE